MAKFVNKNLRLKDNQYVTFGDGLDVDFWFDSSEFRVNSTISGVDPTQDYHLTTRFYVDEAIATATGTLTGDHGDLLGLDGDDHTQYVPVDGSRGFTSTVSGVTPTQDYHFSTKGYVDGEISTVAGSIITDHGALTGRDDDDHTLYTLVDGTRAFTDTVGGVTPNNGSDLTTKDYVDALVNGLSWQEPVINFSTAASGITTSGNRYIASATGGGWTIDNIYTYNGIGWDETVTAEGFATYIDDLDKNYTYNGTNWVSFGSTANHNNLAGLQGGTGSQYYHLTSAQHSGLTGGSDTTLHTHDGRYYTETEIDTIISTTSGSLQSQLDSHSHVPADVTGFNEASQDAVGNIMSGVGGVTVSYDDSGNTITVSGTPATAIDHGDLLGRDDDDHTQYILANGNRAFTGEVVGIDPTVSGSLATKAYVDAQNTGQTSVYEHGRQVIGDDASSVAVTFSSALVNTNYTVNCTLENTSDSPPSLYVLIVSAKQTTGFTVVFSGDMDSANYYLDWQVIED